MTYCTRANIEEAFGVENVKAWADLDNDKDATKIANRITRAIAVASNDVDVKLRGGPYQAPYGASGTPDVAIVDITARLAGVWLYESRGVQDFAEQTGEPVHRLAWHKRDCTRTLRQIRAGLLQLSGPAYVTVPSVVADDAADE